MAGVHACGAVLLLLLHTHCARVLTPCLPAPCFPPHTLHATRQQKRVASLRTRTVSTLAMIAGFVAIIWLGHVPLVLLVLTLQVRLRLSGP